MKLEGSIAGRDFIIEMHAEAASWRFRLDGGPERTAVIAQPEPQVFLILLNGRSYEARVEKTGDTLLVSLEGQRFTIRIRDPRRWSRTQNVPAGDGPENVTAPMPGRVVRLLVSPGESVKAGQGIAVVEAMKMQNELKATKAGRVIAVSFAEGDAVVAGDILAMIE